MARSKMTKDTIPDDFTITLAIVDALPVLFFCATMVLIGLMFHSVLFIIGASLVIFAGVTKVLWKIVVVLRKKNIWWMFLQMRILMPFGMLLMLLSLILHHDQIQLSILWSSLTSMPSGIFFLIGVLGMTLMTIFAFKLDSSDLKSNWIEQLTNALAQAAFFVGVLLLM